MTERKVPVHRTSDYSFGQQGEVSVSTVEDLEALSAKYGCPLILTLGEDGKLGSIEVYDTYRE
jgi:hypothetical protein